ISGELRDTPGEQRNQHGLTGSTGLNERRGLASVISLPGRLQSWQAGASNPSINVVMRRYLRTGIVKRFFNLLVLLVTVSSCDSPVAPVPITVVMERVPLLDETDYREWPFTPSISGGSTITVRGMVRVECG